jgi:ferric-dicitrate binding protein FerR (iron transport regulator)
MPNINAKEILRKYREGTATAEEKEVLENWIFFGKQKAFDLTDEELENELSLLEQNLPLQISKPIKRWPKIAVAASTLILLSAGAYFTLHKKEHNQLATRQSKMDIAPGRNRATLTLANGQKIVLTKGMEGQLAQQGSSVVNVNQQNAITYTPSNSTSTSAVLYNTLSTARGEQSPFPLVLADGSKVWLNAMSSITFPTSFSGKDRVVKVTGEAYFEVVHNARRPFKVSFKGHTVEDIGTQFDINAYDDEQVIKTTLVEGKIKLSKNLKTVVLRPGQQGITTVSNSVIDVKDADIDVVAAWKDGKFKFRKTKVDAVMRQLSRWYDVDVAYPNGIPNIVFTGEMIKDVNASQILDMLAYFKVDYQIVQQSTGKKIIIKP